MMRNITAIFVFLLLTSLNSYSQDFKLIKPAQFTVNVDSASVVKMEDGVDILKMTLTITNISSKTLEFGIPHPYPTGSLGSKLIVSKDYERCGWGNGFHDIFGTIKIKRGKSKAIKVQYSLREMTIEGGKPYTASTYRVWAELSPLGADMMTKAVSSNAIDFVVE